MKIEPSKHSTGFRVFIIILAVVLVGSAVVIWWFLSRDKATSPPVGQTISNYEQCVAASGVILETYPEQCKTSDGRTFVRDISGDVKTGEYTSVKGVKIIVDQPTKNELVSLPLKISGKVPGNWSFEASFPVELQDSNGKALSSVPAQLSGDWMTTELVPFSVTISTISRDYSGKANLVLRKDNPSGLSDKDDYVTIPVVIK